MGRVLSGCGKDPMPEEKTTEVCCFAHCGVDGGRRGGGGGAVCKEVGGVGF